MILFEATIIILWIIITRISSQQCISLKRKWIDFYGEPTSDCDVARLNAWLACGTSCYSEKDSVIPHHSATESICLEMWVELFTICDHGNSSICLPYPENPLQVGEIIQIHHSFRNKHIKFESNQTLFSVQWDIFTQDHFRVNDSSYLDLSLHTDLSQLGFEIEKMEITEVSNIGLPRFTIRTYDTFLHEKSLFSVYTQKTFVRLDLENVHFPCPLFVETYVIEGLEDYEIVSIDAVIGDLAYGCLAKDNSYFFGLIVLNISTTYPETIAVLGHKEDSFNLQVTNDGTLYLTYPQYQEVHIYLFENSSFTKACRIKDYCDKIVLSKTSKLGICVNKSPTIHFLFYNLSDPFNPWCYAVVDNIFDETETLKDVIVSKDFRRLYLLTVTKKKKSEKPQKDDFFYGSLSVLDISNVSNTHVNFSFREMFFTDPGFLETIDEFLFFFLNEDEDFYIVEDSHGPSLSSPIQQIQQDSKNPEMKILMKLSTEKTFSSLQVNKATNQAIIGTTTTGTFIYNFGGISMKAENLRVSEFCGKEFVVYISASSEHHDVSRTTSFIVTFDECKNGRKHEKNAWEIFTSYFTHHLSIFIPSLSAAGLLIILLLLCCCCCFIILPIFVIVGCVLCCCCCQELWNTRRKNISEEEKRIRRRLLGECDPDKDPNYASLVINQTNWEIEKKELKNMDLLGSGGGGCVLFKAKWRRQNVCVKMFRQRYSLMVKVKSSSGENASTEIDAFVMSLMAGVSHPNILRWYGFILEVPKIGIVMEFCENGDLEECLRKEKIESLETRIKIIKEISYGMSYLHSRKILHRDLKPQNVLLDDNFIVKIMDFGLSRKIQGSKNMPSKSRMKDMTKHVGTSFFIAPEVVLNSTYSFAVDVFSFSILTYVLLTKNLNPYGEVGWYGVEYKVAQEPDFRPKMSEEMVEEVSNAGFGWLIKMMVRGWHNDPKTRPTFQEFEAMFVDNL